MSQPPPRPPFDAPPDILQANAAFFEETARACVDVRPWHASYLDAGLTAALDRASTLAALDPDHPGILASLEQMASFAAAMFVGAASAPGAEIEVPLPGGGRVALVAAGPDRQLASPLAWWRGMHAALAARHREAIELLATTSISLLHALAPQHPGWAWHEIEALQAIARRAPDAPERIVVAARAADPDQVPEASRDWILDVVAPELDLGFRAIDRDAAAFDRAMVTALSGHHHYYGRPPRTRDVRGQLALAPLAMACVAADLGVRTTISSAYLPRAVIDA